MATAKTEQEISNSNCTILNFNPPAIRPELLPTKNIFAKIAPPIGLTDTHSTLALIAHNYRQALAIEGPALLRMQGKFLTISNQLYRF